MKSRLIAVAALAILMMPALSAAVSSRPGPYVSGFIGVSIPSETDVTSYDFIDNETFNDQVEFDPGLAIGGTGGYDFGFIRLEGELSYKYAEMSDIINKDFGIRYRSVDGEIGALSMMFNAFFDLQNDSPITPYLGGGIGFATLYIGDTYGTDTTGGVADRVLLYPSDDTTVFAYQAGAGLEVAIHRNFSLDIGYRYFATTEGTFDSDVDTNVDLKFESHNATVGFRVKF